MKTMRLFFSILVLIPTVVMAQYKFQPVPVGLMFISGASKGTADFLQFHYTGNSKFWNPDLSWQNKWKNDDPAQGEKFLGSSTIFVTFTDGWHMMNTCNKYSTILAITVQIGGKKKPFKYYLYDFVIYSLAYSAGFVMTYEIIFKD